MERAAEKLRTEGMCCRHVTVFIRSSPFAERETHYANQISMLLPIPTADTRELLAQIEPLLSRIWLDDVRYMKGGVMLADFSPKGMQQGGLFGSEQQDPRSDALMQVIDRINQGRLGKVYFASRGRDTSEWMMKREQLSPRYTTSIKGIPVVKA